MKVRAHIPSVEEVEVYVPKNLKIEYLKETICRRLKIEPEFTRLLLDGKILDERKILSQFDARSKKIEVDYLWARHLILWGKRGQAKIRDSTILIAGAGALGNEIAKNLAMLGVMRLIIVDYDVVELSNVSRMIFFDRSDAGKSKAKVLAQKLHKKFPRTEIVAYNCALETIPLGTFLESDVIICGLDNVASRIFLTSISRKYSIPMVDGGIIGYQARVQVYVPPDAPCPICPLPSSQYAQLIGLRNPCDARVEEAKTPSLPTSISFVSSIQTQEALKLILGYKDFMESRTWPKHVGEPLKGILIADLKYNRYSNLDLRRNETCIVCGKEGVGRDLVQKIEIPLKSVRNSASRLQKLVSRQLDEDAQELQLFKITVGEPVKIDYGTKLSLYGMGRDAVVQAIFKKKPDEYKEAIVRFL
jgi:molybdopterin/thiamine biosynthesis adenylyltransferase